MKKKFELFAAIVSMIAFYNCTSSDSKNNMIETKDSEISLSTDSILFVDPNIISFGEIDADKKDVRPFTFKITNLSDSLLVIEKIDVSCQCVTVSSYPDSLASGKGGEIRGTIDLKKQSGHMRKSIFVNYNNGSIKMLKIKADIKK